MFFDSTERDMISIYATILYHETKKEHFGDESTVKCAIILFLANFHLTHYQMLVISESTMMEGYDAGKFLKYLTTHYSDVTLKSMTQYFNFYPTYFSLLFKQLVGYTFSEKLLMIKLEQAKWLLVTTDLPIQHIIELIGFKEKSYFHKCFKKQYGMTPGQYRKILRN